MTLLTKKPIQIYLRQEQLDTLRALAEQRGVSIASLVRQGVDRLLTELPADQDPLQGIVGLGDSGLGDLSVEHDRYLAELEREDSRQ